MYIRDVSIENYGIFSQENLRSLPSGVTVILGKNEAGKSTALSFFRSMLFGFLPKSTKTELAYPALTAGNVRGSLVIETQKFGTLVLGRDGGSGRNKGSVSLRAADGTPYNESMLDALLGGVTRELFRSVYAFSLDELQNRGLLDDDKMRTVLYGASFGNSTRPIGDALAECKASLDKLYTPRGSVKSINVLLREVQGLEQERKAATEESRRFDAYSKELAELQDALRALHSNTAALTAEMFRYKQLVNVQGTWEKYQETRTVIENLHPAISTFPARGAERLEETLRTIQEEETRCGHLRASVAALTEERNSLAPNAALLAQRDALRRLSEGKGQYADACKTADELQQTMAQHADALARCYRELGAGWDASRVRAFDHSIFMQNRVQDFALALSARGEAVRAALQEEKQQKDALRSVAEERAAAEKAMQSLGTVPLHREEGLTIRAEEEAPLERQVFGELSAVQKMVRELPRLHGELAHARNAQAERLQSLTNMAGAGLIGATGESGEVGGVENIGIAGNERSGDDARKHGEWTNEKALALDMSPRAQEQHSQCFEAFESACRAEEEAQKVAANVRARAEESARMAAQAQNILTQERAAALPLLQELQDTENAQVKGEETLSMVGVADSSVADLAENLAAGSEKNSAENSAERLVEKSLTEHALTERQVELRALRSAEHHYALAAMQGEKLAAQVKALQNTRRSRWWGALVLVHVAALMPFKAWLNAWQDTGILWDSSVFAHIAAWQWGAMALALVAGNGLFYLCRTMKKSPVLAEFAAQSAEFAKEQRSFAALAAKCGIVCTNALAENTAGLNMAEVERKEGLIEELLVRARCCADLAQKVAEAQRTAKTDAEAYTAAERVLAEQKSALATAKMAWTACLARLGLPQNSRFSHVTRLYTALAEYRAYEADMTRQKAEIAEQEHALARFIRLARRLTGLEHWGEEVGTADSNAQENVLNGDAPASSHTARITPEMLTRLSAWQAEQEAFRRMLQARATASLQCNALQERMLAAEIRVQEASAERQAAENAQKLEQDAWQNYLEERHLPRTMHPEQVHSAVSRIQDAARLLDEEERNNAQLAQALTVQKNMEQALTTLWSATYGEACALSRENYGAMLTRLQETLDASLRAEARAAELTRTIAHTEQEVALQEETLLSARKRRHELLHSGLAPYAPQADAQGSEDIVGEQGEYFVDDEERFRRYAALYEEREALRSEEARLFASLRGTMQSNVGLWQAETVTNGAAPENSGQSENNKNSEHVSANSGAALPAELAPLARAFARYSAAELAEELERVSAEKLETEGRQNDIATRCAELKNILATLQDSQKAQNIAEAYEEKRAALRRCADEWSALALAQHLMVGAKQRFEKERQPAVIRAASAFLADMTQGKYTSIINPLGENILQISAENSALPLTPEHLSRGTVEQLYLALRLGYICSQRSLGEPLPVIMDDIMVNFDPERQKGAARALATLSTPKSEGTAHLENSISSAGTGAGLSAGAGGNQIIYFTCHPQSAELLQNTCTNSKLFVLENGHITEK